MTGTELIIAASAAAAAVALAAALLMARRRRSGARRPAPTSLSELAAEKARRAQIAYDLDTDMLATCTHLQRIEQDMRRAGLKMTRVGERQVDAACVIDVDMLRAQYFPLGRVEFVEALNCERAADDPQGAWLLCDECGSQIRVVRRAQAPAGAPNFP